MDTSLMETPIEHVKLSNGLGFGWIEFYDEPNLNIDDLRELSFEMKGSSYYIELGKVKGKWRTGVVYHGENSSCCPICREIAHHSDPCLGFEKEIKEFSKKILSHPNIRLKLLFN